MLLLNVIRHFKKICVHKYWVFYYCCKSGMPLQGLVHDLSKFSPTEFWESVRYYQGTSSPIDACKKANGWSAAWLHHKGCNKHHWEYYTDVSINPEIKGMVGLKMPFKYVVEMFCDRVAACKAYNGTKYMDSDPYNYYIAKKYQDVMHEDVEKELVFLLIMLNSCGEEYTFKIIKRILKEGKRVYELSRFNRRRYKSNV